MILLCGIPSESPMALVREQLDSLQIPYIIFNQRCFDTIELEFQLAAGEVTGNLWLAGQHHRLEDFQGVYTRLMEYQLLPEFQHEPPDSPKRQQCQRLHDALTQWYEIAPARVVNRTGPMGSNFSKPYQTQLIQAEGFAIPETLITNDPELVQEFYSRHDRVIYKSISGVRSIVQVLAESDLERLEQIRWCPTQFQAFVAGTNVRVHVVGQEVFATAVHSKAVDYRYASLQVGESADLVETKLSPELAQRCVRLAHALGLAFAGIDLKVTPKGQIFCFEVNPSPAFSYYELNTAQTISRSVARYLAGLS
jgi:hypothetical protein